jgi:hypothetical protein
LPATLQAAHEPVHASLQQTPSTQNPDAHSPAPAHDVPFGCCGTQVEPEQ